VISGGRGGRGEHTAAEGGAVTENSGGCVADGCEAGECERRPTTTVS